MKTKKEIFDAYAQSQGYGNWISLLSEFSMIDNDDSNYSKIKQLQDHI